MPSIESQVDSDTNLIASIRRWFERAVPSPSAQNQHTQLGCHFEEVAEMLDTLKTDSPETFSMIQQAKQTIHTLANHLKANDNVLDLEANRVDMLDALCDQIVTATGVGYMMHLNILAAVAEVNDSNWSKFVNGQPIFNDQLKIQKGPSYFRANLISFI